MRRPLIYSRFSTTMQGSCGDQERKVTEHLAKLRIDTTTAITLRDEAISGTIDDRENYKRLKNMIELGQVSVLAVDDQSRLSRGSMVVALIQDLLFQGGRFIAVADKIDTELNPNWEMSATFKQLQNSSFNKDLAYKVRRGQEGRVLDGLCSTGDYPIGYRSEYVDDDWLEQIQRGRKPRKRIVIDEQESEPIEQGARAIRLIFRLFTVDMLSINQIAKRLNAMGVRKSKRAQGKPWDVSYVAFILHNPKYVGQSPQEGPWTTRQ